MIKQGQRYLVMGVLDPNSIAYHIGRTLAQHGAEVVYSMQNEVFKRRFFDRSTQLTDAEKAALKFHYCDVTQEESVAALFNEVGNVRGVVHSIAYANPKTCLGPEFHTEAMDDVMKSYHISCASLATVARHAAPHMPD